MSTAGGGAGQQPLMPDRLDPADPSFHFMLVLYVCVCSRKCQSTHTHLHHAHAHWEHIREARPHTKVHLHSCTLANTTGGHDGGENQEEPRRAGAQDQRA
jgi:hypothetical protein